MEINGKPKYSVFERLCSERNVSPADVSKATGVTTSTLSQWKKKHYDPQEVKAYYPKPDKIVLIAEYFGVTMAEFYEGA